MSASGLSSRAIMGEFYNRLDIGATAWVEKIGGEPFTSNQGSEDYKWLGQSPVMREWVGGRHAKGLRENGFTIYNKKFEATLEVSLDDIRRDKTGQVMVRVGETADRVNSHWASLLSTLIQNGATGICYDGQYFFDTDHVEGENSIAQSNKITFDISDDGASVPSAERGIATAPSVRTMELAILAGIQAIMGFKDDQNEPMNENALEFEVQVPAKFMSVALAACASPIVGAGATNSLVAQGTFKVTPRINPRLTWTDRIAVFRADGQTKPFVLQEEEKVTVSAVAEGSELEFKEDKHLYGVKAIRNAGYGYWQHACMVIFQD